MTVTIQAMTKDNQWGYPEKKVTITNEEYKRLIRYCLDDINFFNNSRTIRAKINDQYNITVTEVNGRHGVAWIKCLHEHMLDIGLLEMNNERMKVSKTGERWLVGSKRLCEVWKEYCVIEGKWIKTGVNRS